MRQLSNHSHKIAARLRVLQRRLRACDVGAAAVEAAFTFPIYFLLLYGIIEFSHYSYTSMAVSDAAREGVRYAVVRGANSAQPATSSSITTYIKGRLALLSSALTTVAVTYTPDNQPGSAVKVQVSYPFSPFMPGFGYLAAKTVTSSSQMTIAQ